jgi:GntR family transcriptional regulator, arabinose operon transcriptional repressor
MNEKKPLYRVIYNELLRRIDSGEYKPGDKIPTEAEWAETYKVSRITSKKALDMAAENLIIVKHPGRGSFIADDSKKMIGRNQSTKRKVFGLIQHNLSDSFGLEIFQTLERLAQDADILTLTGISNDEIEREKRLLSNFLSYGVDGFIIFPAHNESFNNDILKLILDGFPVVLIDRYLKDVSCPNVISKNFEAAQTGINHLYSLGHRNIGILSRPIGSTTTLMEREKGIMHAIVENGYKFKQEWWLTDLETIDTRDEEAFIKAKEKIKAYLLEHRELTAVFGLKYSVVPVVEAAAHELGIRIPEDLSLICFDAPSYLVNRIKPITHLKQNEKKIAECAFSLIQKMLNGQEFEHRQEIEIEFIQGETTIKVKD